MSDRSYPVLVEMEKAKVHQGNEPFVTPSGARQDDIVRSVRACPSGALSYGVDGREARELVDVVRPPGIEISLDGLYRVTGGIPLVDDDAGRPSSPTSAHRRSTIASAAAAIHKQTSAEFARWSRKPTRASSKS